MNGKVKLVSKFIGGIVTAIVILVILFGFISVPTFVVWNTVSDLSRDSVFKITIWESFTLTSSILFFIAIVKSCTRIVEMLLSSVQRVHIANIDLEDYVIEDADETEAADG